jgi:UDP-glucose 4-epimerase
MRCLVTGGAGFIGSNIVDRLIRDGHEVRVIDNESSDSHEHFYWNDNADNHILDINDYSSVDMVTKDIECVFHLAAESRIQPAIQNPILTTQTNVVGTCNVLQSSRNNGVKRFIYSSTSASYGLKNKPPVNEDMENDCINAYSITKCAGEDLCKMFHNLYGLKTVTFRYFNVYGERQPIRGQYAPVVGLFQRQHENGELMTVVGDGLQRRDFTYVDDVVEANVLAATTNNDMVFGETFNIGTGKNYNIFDLVHMVGGDDAEYVHIPPRVAEIRMSLADCRKAQKLLKWKPKTKLNDWIELCKQQLA